MSDCIQSATHPHADLSQPASHHGPGLSGLRHVHLNRQATLTFQLVHPTSHPPPNRPSQQGTQHTMCTPSDQPKHWLILPDPTAIGIGLRYASRTPVTTFRSGEPLSNTLTTYPQNGANYGKIGAIRTLVELKRETSDDI